MSDLLEKKIFLIKKNLYKFWLTASGARRLRTLAARPWGCRNSLAGGAISSWFIETTLAG